MSLERAQAAVDMAAALVRETTPCLLEAILSPEGVAEIGYRLRLLRRQGVMLLDTLSAEEAEKALAEELRACWLLADGAIAGWDRVGPARQAAAIAFLLGPGSDVPYGKVRDFRDRLRALRGAWGSPEEVGDLLVDFCRDGVGRVSQEFAQRRNHEALLWRSEEVPVTQLRAKQDTYIKRAPIQQSYLSSSGKFKIAAGTVYAFESVEDMAADAHDRVGSKTLRGDWFIFGPHWEPVVAPKPVKGKLPFVDWGDMDSPLGRFQTVGENLRNDPRRRPAIGSPQEEMILRMAAEFDKIRAAWGGPIMITSGYRPEPINRAVGGVRNSRHVVGDALDIFPADGRLTDMFNWLKIRWSGGLGDGRKRGFIHIDMRDNGRFHPNAGVRPAVIWPY